MSEQYEANLIKITAEINSYFIEQKDYIKCCAGCDICCSNAYYPVSKAEYDYLKKGLNLFYSQEETDFLNNRAWDIFKSRTTFLKHNSNIHEFEYVCPFLKQKICSVYDYRPLICRMYGLITKDSADPDGRGQLPYCINLNLNYINVWDHKINDFSTDKIKASGFKAAPKSYDVSCSSLMKSFGDTDFGDVRMLYEWIIMDIPDYQNIMNKLKKELDL